MMLDLADVIFSYFTSSEEVKVGQRAYVERIPNQPINALHLITYHLSVTANHSMIIYRKLLLYSGMDSISSQKPVLF